MSLGLLSAPELPHNSSKTLPKPDKALPREVRCTHSAHKRGTPSLSWLGFPQTGAVPAPVAAQLAAIEAQVRQLQALRGSTELLMGGDGATLDSSWVRGTEFQAVWCRLWRKNL